MILALTPHPVGWAIIFATALLLCALAIWDYRRIVRRDEARFASQGRKRVGLR